MKNLSISLATLAFGIGAVVSTAEAGPGGSGGYTYHSPSAYGAAPTTLARQITLAGWVGNDGDICRNLDLTCKGIGHGPIGWYCSGCGFSGWWSSD